MIKWANHEKERLLKYKSEDGHWIKDERWLTGSIGAWIRSGYNETYVAYLKQLAPLQTVDAEELDYTLPF